MKIRMKRFDTSHLIGILSRGFDEKIEGVAEKPLEELEPEEREMAEQLVLDNLNRSINKYPYTVVDFADLTEGRHWLSIHLEGLIKLSYLDFIGEMDVKVSNSKTYRGIGLSKNGKVVAIYLGDDRLLHFVTQGTLYTDPKKGFKKVENERVFDYEYLLENKLIESLANSQEGELLERLDVNYFVVMLKQLSYLEGVDYTVRDVVESIVGSTPPGYACTRFDRHLYEISKQGIEDWMAPFVRFLVYPIIHENQKMYVTAQTYGGWPEDFNLIRAIRAAVDLVGKEKFIRINGCQ